MAGASKRSAVQRLHDDVVSLGASCDCARIITGRKSGERLWRFNPNHYGPGERGGQFAPTDEGGTGASATTGPQTAQEFPPLFARPPIVPEEIPQFKETIPRLSGEEGAKDAPGWARGMRPYVGESGKDFAKRLLDEKYGPGKWNDTGPRSEYNRLKKYGDRNFRDPKSLLLPDDNGA